jgi:hypothetical protein
MGIVQWFNFLLAKLSRAGKPGRGRKRLSKSSGNGNMEESMTDFYVFLVPPIPTVLRCSFLFLLARNFVSGEKPNILICVALGDGILNS